MYGTSPDAPRWPVCSAAATSSSFGTSSDHFTTPSSPASPTSELSVFRRRLNTLSSLVGLAGELGVVKWSLEVPNEEEVAAAEQTGQRGASGDVPYILPHHATEPAEIDRLDVQHYALRGQLGANYLAPLKQPSRI